MITLDQIQSIVDGECSHEGRALLLREIESQPAAWRALALALLEEQQWSNQIAQLANRKPPVPIAQHAASSPIVSANALLSSPSLSSPSLSSPSLSSPSLSSPSLSSPSLSSQGVRPPVRLSDVGLHGTSNEDIGRKGIPWLTILAASLLLGLGFYGGSFLPNLEIIKSEGVSTSALAGIEKQVSDRGDYSLVDDTFDTNMKMLVSGPNSETAEIPIYDLNAVDHDLFVAKEMYEVARINQRLRREGFELDVRPEYYTGKLHDGRQLIVPVKHVGVKPYGL